MEKLDRIQKSIDKLNELAIVTDSEFRIVLTNDIYKKTNKVTEYSEFFGKRPGEVFNCIFSKMTNMGCGHSDFCQYCKVLLSLKNVALNHSLVRTQATVYSTTNIAEDNIEYDVTVFTANDFDDYLVILFREESEKNNMNKFFELVNYDLKNDINLLKNIFDILTQNENTITQEEKKELISITDASLANIKEITAFQNQLCRTSHNFETNIQIINTLELFGDIKKQIKAIYKNIVLKIGLDSNSINYNFEAPNSVLSRLIRYLILNLIRMDSRDVKIQVKISKEQNYLIFNISRNISISDKYGLDLIIKKVTNKMQTEDLMFHAAKYLAESILKGKLEFFTTKEDGSYYKFIFPIIENNL